MAESYENLNIWKDGVSLASSIYRATKKFPKEEIYGITSQIRRAVVSISSNIAEGSGRGTKKDNAHFIDIAIGSLNEVESLLHIAFELGYIDKTDFSSQRKQIASLGLRLGGFRKYLYR